ncbi:DNA-(apurinic or apyrimidinic site) endonuclease 2 isoform X2 [Dendropsophus ebraccatus]|uniref:DNA-(apurinic or apyrimidinic site) endonuclease 2 isoform X2 n=1 Tax=Dendropsophus ebraccatus TaxID=150705 RepID=UPI003832066D
MMIRGGADMAADGQESCRMKIVSWNINGIRATRVGLKEILDSLDADIICLQETKVTRDLLEEPVAIVEGYNSYFSFSRVRSGYSGVATFCRSCTTPLAAEEGLSGQLSGQRGSIGCYGNTEEFSGEELLSLDQEGRAVITQHKILHVIILGDVNTSHKPLDHCDPTDLEVFEENPGRQWLNQFLADPSNETNRGLFVDSFRYFHPTQKNAFTCWCSASGARQTNYGTRIDYILASRKLVEGEFLDSLILPEVEGSDHCPVKALMKCDPLSADKCPPLCTKYLPEFAGRQQKLSQFLVKRNKDAEVSSGDTKELSSSQSSSEGSEQSSARKRTVEKVSGSNGKKGKLDPKGGQGSLLGFFKPVVSKSSVSERQNNSSDPVSQAKNMKAATQQDCSPAPTSTTLNGNQQQSAFWKSLLKGPPPPPNCKGHGEPCVLRTVKKAGPNCGRQFYVCARPEGHSSNPQARCNFFLWVNKKSGAEG